jgi:hypothetical protein
MLIMQFVSFGSIGQFRDIIKKVNDRCNYHQIPKPAIEFYGSVKLHGTNAGIVFDRRTDELQVQSRERVITPFDDNANFAKYVNTNKDFFLGLLDQLAAEYDMNVVALFGEWAGEGINKGVAINGIPKTLFVFTIRLMDEFPGVADDGTEAEVKQFWLTPEQINAAVIGYQSQSYGQELIYSIYDEDKFSVEKIVIDFADPIHSQNALVELTMDVEKECPVGKYFGHSGIGEGRVWWNPQLNMKFKVKGEKHSTTKVKTVKEIAAVDIALHNSMREFVTAAVSQARLEQGIVKLGEMGLPVDTTSTGKYLEWIARDILKEEMDVICASNFDKKALMPMVNAAAKDFWFKYLKESAGLQ